VCWTKAVPGRDPKAWWSGHPAPRQRPDAATSAMEPSRTLDVDLQARSSAAGGAG